MFPYKYLLSLFLIISFTFQCVNAQSKLLRIDKKYNFGTVENWENQEAIFYVKNVSEIPVQILNMGNLNNDIVISMPLDPIMPGQTETITVYCYPYDVGKLDISIPVFNEHENDPVNIKIVGNIKSISPNAQLSCPGTPVAPKPKEPVVMIIKYDQSIAVVDAETQRPIKNPKVVITDEYGNDETAYARERGTLIARLPDGRFAVKVYKDGYNTKEVIAQFNRTTEHLVIELDRPKEEVVSMDLEYYKRKNLEEAKRDLEPVEYERHVFDDEPKTKENNRPIEQEYDESVVVEEEVDTAIPLIDENGQLSKVAYKPNNIIFLIDVSKSMEDQNKLNRLKKSLQSLNDKLRDIDQVSLITFSSKVNIVSSGISSDNKEEINAQIDGFVASGGTRGISGIEKAYELMDKNYIPGGNNQIILATDGEFKNNDSDIKELASKVRKKSKKGFKLSVMGFAQNKQASTLMKRLAYSGKGNYINIQSSDSAAEILLEEIKENSIRSYF